MPVLDALERALVAAWPYVYSWATLVIGLGLMFLVWRSIANGYVYPDFKYAFVERNRVYRRDDPFWYWFFVLLYGAIALFLTAFGCVALLRVAGR